MPAVGAQPGEQVDQLLRFMMASGTALFIYVAGYLIYFSIAFRAKPGDGPDAVGVQVHDNHVLEFWWTLIPTLFVVLLSILSVKIWYQIQVAQPANGLVVESLGHQWYFTFRYPQVNGESYRRDALADQPAGGAQRHVVRRYPLVLGAGVSVEGRYGAGADQHDPLHADRYRALSDHLH